MTTRHGETTAPYEPSSTEQVALASNAERKAARSPLIGVKVTKAEGGTTRIQVSHRDPTLAEPLLCEQFGTDISEFASLLVEQLGHLSIVKSESGETVSDNVLNAHITMVRGIAPTDEIEAMLACQMAAVHMLSMGAATSAYRGVNAERRDLALAQINKLTRTFTTQMEALKRYRSKGDQKVTVEHVHVHDGGQAVVGNVTQNRSNAA